MTKRNVATKRNPSKKSTTKPAVLEDSATPEVPAPLVSWRELRVWSLAGDRLDEADARDALAEYRRTGAMTAWLADPADYGPDGEPLSGEGPELDDAGPSHDEIDWAGFPGGAS